MTEVDHETGHWAWKREEGDDGTRSLKAAQSLSPKAAEVARKARENAITSPDGRLTLLQGDVRFTDVTFGYNPDKPVLHDITWFAKPGQKVALVGATGAGKTTVTNLINRFYDIQEGMILYDGISVKGIRKPDLRKSLGIVLQDVNLFTGTVMDNIRYGQSGRHRRGVHRRRQARQRGQLHPHACPTATRPCSKATAPACPRASAS